VLYEGAWGALAQGSREPMTPSAPFEIASITKMFTATAILLLIGSGRLASLSQPLSTVAPRLLLDCGAPPHWHAATLRQLLQHTSGIQCYWQDPAFLQAFTADEQRLWKPMDMLGYAARMPPAADPGVHHYSDTNFVLAGLVVEEVTGMPLGEYLRQAIFDPLGLNATYFNHLEPPFRSPIAHRYEGREDLTLKRRQSADWAGGGLVSTTKDLNRFLLQGLVNGRLGGPSILREMLPDSVPTDTDGVEYGLGLFLIDAEEELGQGARVWGHEGWAHSFVYYDEQAGIVVSGTVNQQDERADPYDAIMAAMAAGRRILKTT